MELLKATQGSSLFTTLKRADLDDCFHRQEAFAFIIPSLERSSFISPPPSRRGGLVRSGHPHGLYRCHRLRADRSDLPHPAGDDSGDPGQRRGPVAAAVPLRLHHQDQEAALPARAGLGPPRVRTAQHGTHFCSVITVTITKIDTAIYFCTVKQNQSYVAQLCSDQFVFSKK